MSNSEYSILGNIKSPDDLKELSLDELNQLAEELRQKIIKTVSVNGGHLASNLGVIELTLALHTVLECPKDKIIWDVGHQSYAHKMLTGRYEKIDTIRKENGLSGFPKREESPYDAFNTGHSSTSVSSAYGIYCAEHAMGKGGMTVAVIGDGALSGGLALEGINNVGRSKKKLVIILNDNEMSISKNVGSMAKYLTNLRIKPSYVSTKDHIQDNLRKMSLLGRPLYNMMKNMKNGLKNLFLKQDYNIFEQFGFTYYGPLDGHDIYLLQSALRTAKRCHGPVLIHVCTKKGKGYEFAEKKPSDYHGIGAFDMETGEPLSSYKGYSAVFGNYLCELAETDKKICAITAAMQDGTGLAEFAKKYKERFYDVGIAEEHAVTFGAGLAAGGMIPVFAVYSTFLQRSYDQILHDAALQNLHMVLAIDRAGIVGDDGETHQGIFDVAFLNTIPNITLYAPSSFDELRKMLYLAIYQTDGPVAVRYPRGKEDDLPADYEYTEEEYYFYGKKNAKILVITYGRIFSYACQAKEELEKEQIEICILKLNKIKSLNRNAVKKSLGFEKIYFFEEGIKTGGVGEIFGFELYQSGFEGKYCLTAIEDYVKQAETKSVLKKLGLDTEGIKETIRKELAGAEKNGKKTP